MTTNDQHKKSRSSIKAYLKVLYYLLPIAIIIPLIIGNGDNWPTKVAWSLRLLIIPLGTMAIVFMAERWASGKNWSKWVIALSKFGGMLLGIFLFTSFTTLVIDGYFSAPALQTSVTYTVNAGGDTTARTLYYNITDAREPKIDTVFGELPFELDSATNSLLYSNADISADSLQRLMKSVQETQKAAHEKAAESKTLEVTTVYSGGWINYLGQLVLFSMVGMLIMIPVLIRDSRRQERDLEFKEKELEINKLHQLKAKAELETLQAKINPHFLYNSLNSIASLIHTKPDAAENMVLGLSDLFRYSINSQGENITTVDEELKMVQTYLEIEHHRFGDKLQFELEVDEPAKQKNIPRFLIQPLVENAIKHGISKMRSGTLRLQVKSIPHGLEIKVFDNGPDFSKDLMTGYGLKSIYDKLNLLFPGKYEIEMNNGANKHVKITLKDD